MAARGLAPFLSALANSKHASSPADMNAEIAQYTHGVFNTKMSTSMSAPEVKHKANVSHHSSVRRVRSSPAVKLSSATPT
mmetsp:Transcript_115856/g.327831  ORF Transcript_115856/g.327831 Transcript_115856/m.327831 type:complete len:80 (+) Transcript_115856:568-807(+)